MTDKQSSTEGKKRGRPTEAPKSYHRNFRFGEEDMKKLRTCAEVLNKSETEILRIGIDKVFEEVQSQENKKR